jgi:hypothetical protein
MTYCFRYRVRMATPPDIKPNAAFSVTLPEPPEVTVEVVGPAYPIGTWVTFIKRIDCRRSDSRSVEQKVFGSPVHPPP